MNQVPVCARSTRWGAEAMLIIGLTGSIGMGKSTVAGWFANRDVPVADADGLVHGLYGAGGAAVGPIGNLVPDAVVGGAVDRARLSEALQADPTLFAQLEAIVHPLVRDAQRAFIRATHRSGTRLALLDIPLLFETHGDARVDLVVVVDAPYEVQRARVLARPGMTAAKFDAIRAKQMPQRDKRRFADVVINTGLSLDETERSVDDLVAILRERKGTAYRDVWECESEADGGAQGNRTGHRDHGPEPEGGRPAD